MPEKFPINTSDLQGITRLLTDATIGVTDLVEDMQNRIVHPTYLPSTPIQHLITGISGITYKAIRFGAKFFGGGVDKILGQLQPIFGEDKVASDKKENLIAVLNGAVGDYLEKTDNPLFIPMQFRYRGKRITLNALNIKEAYPNMNGKILLMIHGVCMTDVRWFQNGHDHGEKLAEELNLTPVYLYYNGGRHISTNGQNLNMILEELVDNWPLPIEEMQIVAHSMGGLVSRSAVHYGKKENKPWTKHLKKIIFLGTPHHGAPLERVGNYLDLLFEITPYVKPFTRLSKIRSAGLTDLRYGNLIDEDWDGIDRFEKLPDERMPIPLPKNIDCFAIAASKGKEAANNPLDKLVGDGLVPIKSALGQHKNPNQNLSFKKSHTHILFEINHNDLLSNLAVYDKMRTWLAG